jgi:arginase
MKQPKKKWPAAVALVGFPFDAHSSFMQGAAEAPAMIRQALYSYASNLWTENGFDLGADSWFRDIGDICFGGDDSWFSRIYSAISEIIQNAQAPVSLGGDHSITYPIAKAIHDRYGRFCLLDFDAHPDLYHRFQENPFSHASPFARIMEDGLVNRLLQVGVRTLNLHQKEQAGRFGVVMEEMKDWRPGKVIKFEHPLYISFDMDSLDPGFSPGVSHQEPGGFSTRQAIDIIQHIQASAIIGADIVEYNPLRDHQGITARVAAKILKEISGKILEVNKRSSM